MEPLFDGYAGAVKPPRRKPKHSRTAYSGRQRCDQCTLDAHAAWRDGKTPFVGLNVGRWRWVEGDVTMILCNHHDQEAELRVANPLGHDVVDDHRNNSARSRGA
jgi:hypothetical protein